MLRERISRKLINPGGCDRLFQEVRFELRSEVKELILGEEGKGGESLGKGSGAGGEACADLRI